MKKLTLIVTTVSVLFIALFVYSLHQMMKGAAEINREFAKGIGIKIKFNNDTLEIVDYSISDLSYTLSNGSVISIEYAAKNEVSDSLNVNK